MLPLQGDRTPEVLLQTDFFELNAAISPSGRLIAYESSESGDFEIYIRPFPDVGADKRLVSTGGGQLPRWSSDGRELFFIAGGNRLMVAEVDGQEPYEINRPEVLLELDIIFRGGSSYDVSPGSQRFLLNKRVETDFEVSEQTTLVVVENWFEELKRLAPPSE